MDYSDLNSFLKTLDCTNNNQSFTDSENFKLSNEKGKSKYSYENVAINRNNELNNHYNFERHNPQRENIRQKPIFSNELNTNGNKTQLDGFELNRNLQISHITNQRNMQVFDQSKFSEDFKNMNNEKYSNRKSSINEKLLLRDISPSIAFFPGNKAN